jgi:thiamine biosynthesis lipoprotein
MIVDGHRYSHIVDPVSGFPVESFASVSVVAGSCLVAGDASTLGMLLGTDAGFAWLQGLGLPFLCIDAEGKASGSLAG